MDSDEPMDTDERQADKSSQADRPTGLRRDEGGKPVRRRARLDSEHPPDWSAPMSRAQWLIDASRFCFCPCPCELPSQEVGRRRALALSLSKYV
jgi:hypothetical protein